MTDNEKVKNMIDVKNTINAFIEKNENPCVMEVDGNLEIIAFGKEMQYKDVKINTKSLKEIVQLCELGIQNDNQRYIIIAYDEYQEKLNK